MFQSLLFVYLLYVHEIIHALMQNISVFVQNPHLTCSMWLTSKMEQCSLVCMWDTMWLSLYCTGMLQPAKPTIFPPWALWKSYSTVCFKGAWGPRQQHTVNNDYMHCKQYHSYSGKPLIRGQAAKLRRHLLHNNTQ